MAISNLVLTRQIYSEETNGAHAHYREPVPLNCNLFSVTLSPDVALIVLKNVPLYRITDHWWLDQTVKRLIAFRSRKFIACHSNTSVLNNASVLWCPKKKSYAGPHSLNATECLLWIMNLLKWSWKRPWSTCTWKARGQEGDTLPVLEEKKVPQWWETQT